MIWDHDSLWQKAKLYIARAFEVEREGPLFPFWASLALEFVARGTLAAVHPALLADPLQPENLLFALGIDATDKPKSIAITTVYLRCRLVAPEFTEDLAKACTSLSERRNSELHSGDPAFEGIRTSVWLAQFYKSCKVLLASQGKTLADFIPDQQEARVAEEMIAALEEQNRHEASRLIGEQKGQFLKLPHEEQSERIDRAGQAVKFVAVRPGVKIEACPSCGANAALSGTRIRATQPVLHEDELYWENIYLPKELKCYSCGLALEGYAILQGAGFGGQFVEEQTADPSEYYSPAEEYFEEYNNM